ncbi:MAG TPA: type IX secretion system membrane protein PorP/SprF [Bacteroidia bacterium]|nr:type IX secretion system membrane protein PorP/SprF [Bacteroidia bacterium]
MRHVNRHSAGWRRRILGLLLVMLMPFVVLAQQDPHHTQYMFNGLSINPAYAGSRGTVSGMLFYRNQWTGFAGAPVTQSFSCHMPTAKKRAGLGLSVMNDKIGYMSQQWATASYAFIIPVGEDANLALGLRGGVMNFRVNWNEVTATDMGDPIVANNVRSVLMPNVGTGLYFSTPRLYAGLSLPHILNTPLRRSDAGSDAVARLYRHAYFTAGYVLGLQDDVQWKPSILLKYSPGAPLELDVNLMAYIAKRFWIGASWRSGDAVALMLDFQIARHLRLGYAYDYSITALRKFHNGSHELLLGFELFPKPSKMKSPRYF